MFTVSLEYGLKQLRHLFGAPHTLQKRREELERLEKEKAAEIRSYKGLMVARKMTSNKDIAAKGKTLQELEDDFM